MNVDITYNDLYNAGIQDQKINLMYECDKSSSISIKTPYGLTSREEVSKTIAQGEVMSSIKCTTSVDSIAQQAEENISEHLYKYRDTLVIPPLHCVDDQLLISPCGLDSVVTTAYINCQTYLKKLQCHLLHVGKKDLLCPDLMVDSWDLVPRATTIFNLVVSCVTILLSSLLFSSKAWYNVRKRQIQDLEMADETLLRKIFAAHSKTPKELLYTESGNVPVSDGEAARVPLVPAARREGEPAQHVLPRAAVQPRQGRLGAHRPGGHRQSGAVHGPQGYHCYIPIKVQISCETSCQEESL